MPTAAASTSKIPKILARDPSAPHPSLLEAPSVLETPSQAASAGPVTSSTINNNFNINNISNKAYPDLSFKESESRLVDASGHLRTRHERETVFDQLEVRVEMLKRKCKDIVKYAKSLQKNCLANAAFGSSSVNNSMNNSFNNSINNSSTSSYAGSGTGGLDDNNGDVPFITSFTSAASSTGMPPINFGAASGSGVKKRSNGGGLELSQMELKERLRDELIKLVYESRELRNSIQSDAMDKRVLSSGEHAHANFISGRRELLDAQIFSKGELPSRKDALNRKDGCGSTHCCSGPYKDHGWECSHRSPAPAMASTWLVVLSGLLSSNHQERALEGTFAAFMAAYQRFHAAVMDPANKFEFPASILRPVEEIPTLYDR
ncbi:hypothetical protein BJ741DRAFT_663418 [Chytriomyces cf. hyalinus JEL632]|nr:hypothetical protein BJ741DRAFT_663418 [Chytriomyces cf. hyalinus JEL632]